MTTLLWRIEPTPAGSVNLPHLAEDLTLHLRYAPLTTVLVQIGTRQQAYLTGPGCDGCRQQRCGPTCIMQLLRRALIANQAATDLRLVPLGLMKRAYTRLVLAIPGRHAHALGSSMLVSWHEARLWASWRMLFGRPSVGVALAVGTEGPDPISVLRTHGWRAVSIQPLLRPLTSTHIPTTLPVGWHSPIPTHILLSQSGHTAPPQAAECQPASVPLTISECLHRDITPALVAQALATLRNISEQPQASHDQADSHALVESEPCAASSAGASEPPAAQSIDWPAGPGNLPPERLSQLLATLLQSESITQGHPGRVGLAIPRMKRILGLTKPEASALLYWFDQAQLLAPPINPQQPWRQPRPLVTTNLTEIATRLQATPAPTKHAIASALTPAALPLSQWERGQG